jgi:hypothetical protein
MELKYTLTFLKLQNISLKWFFNNVAALLLAFTVRIHFNMPENYLGICYDHLLASSMYINITAVTTHKIIVGIRQIAIRNQTLLKEACFKRKSIIGI